MDLTILVGYTLTYCPINDPKLADCKGNLELISHILQILLIFNEFIVLEPEKSINISSDATSYNLTNLMPYVTYKTIISGYSALRVGAQSEVQTFTTMEAAPSPPRNLTFTNLNSTSVTLIWEAPEHINGVITDYIIWFNRQEHRIGKPTNLTYVLLDLESFTDYKIIVVACTRNCSERSNTIHVKTHVGIPGKIVDPTVKNSKNNINVVSWQKPAIMAGELQYFELKMVLNGEDKVVQLNGTQCTLKMETCSHVTDNYNIYVRAVNVLETPHESKREYIVHESTANDICVEQDSRILRKFHVVDDYSFKLFTGEWSNVWNFSCSSRSLSAEYIIWLAVIFCLLGMGYAVFFGMKKIKKMKDIDVDLPDGIRNIIDETKGGLNLDCAHRLDNKRSNPAAGLLIPREQEQRLLKNRMESQSSTNSTGNSQCEDNEAIDDSELDVCGFL